MKTHFYGLQTMTSHSLKTGVSQLNVGGNSLLGGLRRDTCEELQVGKRFGQHPATLLLHWQGDDHETVSQLREVFDEVVVPAERSRTVRRTDV